MAKTLTITIDDDRMARVEALAAARGMAPDLYVIRLLHLLTDVTPPDHGELPPITRSALGMLKGLPDKPYKELMEEALLEKYGFSK